MQIKNRIQKTFGRNFSAPIITHLQSKGFTALLGGEITPKVVRDVINGETQNITMLEEIVAFTKKTEKRKLKLLNK